MAETWTLGTITRAIAKHLESHRVESARLDAELLVCAVRKVSRTHLYINEHEPIGETELAALRPLTKRRAQHEPMAYILGEREFYGNMILVGPGVLVPRPETELLVEMALAWLRYVRPTQPRILDLCCGSGAIAVAIANAWPDCVLVGADISAEALAMAEKTVRHHGLEKRIELVEADLFEGRTPAARRAMAAPFDIILCNPPYVANHERDSLPRDVRDYEPHQALFAGEEGLDLLRRVCSEAKGHMNASKLLAVEVGHGQDKAVSQYLRPMWPGKCVLEDLSHIPRVIAVWEGEAFTGEISFGAAPERQEGRGRARLLRQQEEAQKAEQGAQQAPDEAVFHVDQAPQGVAATRDEA